MMEDRYTSDDMRRLWSREMQFDRLLQATVLSAKVTDRSLGLGGKLELEAVRTLDDWHGTDRRDVWLARWAELEATYGHDIAAFVEVVRERMNPEYGRYFHLRRTSSDLVDTALAFAMRDALAFVHRRHAEFVSALAGRALEHAASPIVGRTHGQPAEPTSIGRRLAVIAVTAETLRLPTYAPAKMTGPVGTHDPVHAASVLRRAGLAPVASTQIVPRAYLADTLSRLAVALMPVEDFAMLVRLGSRKPAPWCAEPRLGSKPRGSSAMPTKANPVRSERLSGLCAWLRGEVANVNNTLAGLWEERDISHSSVERIALPAITATAEFVFEEAASIAAGMSLTSPGAPVLTGAVALEDLVVRGGMPYTAAYEAIQADGPGVSRAEPRPYDPSTEPELWSWVEARA